MAVSWVFEADQPSRIFERIIETNGGEHIGSFTVDCMPYIPNEKVTIQTTYVLHHSKYPQSTFCIAPGDTYKLSPRMVCDRGFDLILGKMSAGCVPDVLAKFELTGNEYRLVDFIVRIGTALQGTTVKGVVVEVEYGPSSAAFIAKNVMIDFMQTLFKQYVKPVPEVFDKADKPEQYTPMDTMWQFLSIFRSLRKKA